MADLHFGIDVVWQGTGKDGEGELYTGGSEVQYSAPASMGGKGVGTSPEELLLAGITSCYSATLFGILKRSGLPVGKVKVKTDGIVTGFPTESKFSHLTVYPTIVGGDRAKLNEYAAKATLARDKCFIGKTVTGNMVYDVGEVSVEA